MDPNEVVAAIMTAAAAALMILAAWILTKWAIKATQLLLFAGDAERRQQDAWANAQAEAYMRSRDKNYSDW